MKQELVEIVKNLSEDDIIDVLHNFGEQVEEDGYDSFEVLAELILETRLSDIFDFELILTEAINPRARRILVRNQRASQERLNKNKNRLGKFLSKQFSRLKNLFSKKKPENKGPVRGRDYHYDFPVTSTRSRSARSARNRGSSSPSTTQQPPSSRRPSGSSRRSSDDDYDTNDNDSRSRVSTVSRRASYRPSTQQSDSPRGTRGRRSEPSPTAIRVSRSVTPRGITAARNPQAWAAEWKGKRIQGFRAARRAARGAREASQAETQRLANIKQSVASMRADPLRRTGSSGSDTSSVTREILSQRGLPTVPDNPGFKSLRGKPPSDRRGGGQAAAIQRATAAGLSPAQVERIKRRFSSRNQQTDAARQQRTAAKDQERRARETEAQRLSRLNRAAGRPFTGARPIPQSGRPTAQERLAELQRQRANQQQRILSPEAQQTAMAAGVGARKVGLVPATADMARTNKDNQRIGTYSPTGKVGQNRIRAAQRISAQNQNLGVIRDPATRPERSSRPRAFKQKQVTEMLLQLGYVNTYDSAMILSETISDQFFNYLLEEYTYDSQY